MSTNYTYERPTITTIPAARILEMMGPVSCGSGSTISPLPVGSSFEYNGGGGGYQTPSGH